MTRLREWRRMVWTLLSLCFKADPWRSGAMLASEIGINVLLLTAAYSLKLMVDAVVNHDQGDVYVAAVIMAGGAAGAWAFASVYLSLSALVTEHTGVYIDSHLMGLATAPSTIEHHERPDYVDQMTLVRAERRAMPQMMNAMALNVRAALSVLGAVALLVWIQPFLILLPLFGVPLLIANRRAGKLAQQAREANSERIRRRDHLYQTASSPVAGKELRVFGLVDELSRRHLVISREIEQETTHAALHGLRLVTLGSIVAAVGCGSALTGTLYLASKGEATIGSVILALGLTAMVNFQMTGVAQTGAYFQQVVSTARRLLWLTDRATEGSLVRAEPRPVPRRLTEGITLRGVSFTYPGTERLVLDRLELHLPAGSVVALVGENGSGKTTLVKLLTGLHRPTSGRIEIDGVPLDDLDPRQWRARAAGTFQDFAKFEFKLCEAVGVGDLPRIDDSAAHERALDRAGASDLRVEAPDGLQTQLGAHWGGIDLSGGQWQKAAVARGVMRDEPVLRVFDEPSAALDASVEHGLFRRISEVARSGEGSGAVTLLVSHRFSTVTAADLIVVLQEGRITEVGDHHDLMRTGGLYAELYKLQLRAYR